MVLSKKTSPTELSPIVSIISPLNTGSPSDKVNTLPSTRVAWTLPLIAETSPIDNVSELPTWAYCIGAIGPANAFINEPFNNNPFSVSIDFKSWSEK